MNMELEFDSEGGLAYISTEMDASTRLEIFRESDEIRLSLDADLTEGEMSLGVGLNAEDARQVADNLNGLAAELEEE